MRQGPLPACRRGPSGGSDSEAGDSLAAGRNAWEGVAQPIELVCRLGLEPRTLALKARKDQ